MGKKDVPKMVHCRYPKCKFLHETTELKKEDAVKGGSKNSYYHPDCWKVMQTINQIRDIFYKEINPMLTGKQIGMLVSLVNNIVFEKNIEPGYILFALQYFIKYKPGALKYPGGISYIIQDRDVEKAWNNKKNQEKEAEIKEKLKTRLEVIEQPSCCNDIDFMLYNAEENIRENKRKQGNKKTRFSHILE